MRIGFTGSQTLDDDGKRVIDASFAFLEGATEFTTGSCIGVDAYVGKTLVRVFPNAKHRVVVPANRKKVDYWWHPADLWEKMGIDLEVILMPAGSSFRDRNNRILDFTDKLLAFPSHPEDSGKSKRSGTWMTVRLARGRNIEMVPPIIFSELCTSPGNGGNLQP